MSRQRFTTTDVLRLEIEDDPTGLVNLIQNPSGDLGGWGWITPVAGAALVQFRTGTAPGSFTYLQYSPVAGVPNYFYSEPLTVTPGQYVAARWLQGGAALYIRSRFEWLNAAETVIGSTAQSAYRLGSTVAGGGTVYTDAPALAPAGAAKVRLRFDVYDNTSAGNPTGSTPTTALREVTVARAATSAALGTLRTNHVPNPSLEVNAAGWAVVAGCSIARSTAQAYAGAASLAVTAITASPIAGTPEGTAGIPVSPLTRYTVQMRSRAASGSGRVVRPGLFFYDAAGVSLGGSYASGGFNSSGAWTLHTQTLSAPATAVYAQVAVLVTAASVGEVHYVDAVMLEEADTAGAYFDGSTTDAGGWDYSWTGTAHASKSTAFSSSLAYIEPVPFLDVLGPTHEIKVVREALNVGTLEATILDATLDPASSDLIRPGRRVRLMALDSVSAEWLPLFTGVTGEASVSYPKGAGIPDSKRARIQLAAADGMASLANQKRPEGVATVEELPYVLEGAGTPWNVNGSGNQVATATVVAYNDNASAVDQVAVTRDTNLGYAWLDRYGVLQVWDPTALSAVTSAGFTDAEVTDYDVSFNSQDCINEVAIKFLRVNPDTLETEEIPYGPYRNETSIAEWGVRSAEFTVQGLSEETSAIPDLAAAILAANADPVIRINGVTVAVTETEHLTTDLALVDVMALAYVEKALETPTLVNDSLVQRIEHTITPDKWVMVAGFLHEDVVASPQFTPSPTTGAGGKTIGQLLRPVGEVTMWYGAAADVPAPWLLCNGAAIPADYPDLIALVGANTPNMVDVFPIGAGTKAKGTSGGNPTKTIAEANLPAHTHGFSRRTSATAFGASALASASATGTLGTGTTDPTGGGTPLDVMPPWRALYFIIRAR